MICLSSFSFIFPVKYKNAEASQLVNRQHFRGLRFRGLCFRGLCFRGLRFRGLCFRGLRFRGLRFRATVFSKNRQHFRHFRGLRFRSLRFRGLCFRGLRSVVCVFEVCVFEAPLVRPHLDYASQVWSPHQEAVQHRATKLMVGNRVSYKERLNKTSP